MVSTVYELKIYVGLRYPHNMLNLFWLLCANRSN